MGFWCSGWIGKEFIRKVESLNDGKNFAENYKFLSGQNEKDTSCPRMHVIPKIIVKTEMLKLAARWGFPF